MEFVNHGNCTIPYGALWITRENDTEVTLKRCCHLAPFKTLSFEEFSKIDDIIDYTKTFKYSSPEELRKQMTLDRCTTCYFPPDKIKQVVVSLSHACNIHCHDCFFDGHHTDTKQIKDLFFKTLYSVKGHQLYQLQLTDQGEPFFYYNEVVKFLRSLTLNDTETMRFFTNMTLLNKNRILELKKISEETGVKYMFVASVDGITKESFEGTRCGANWEQVMENFDNLISIFDKKDICVCCTIREASIKDLPNIKPFFNSKGVEVNIYYDMLDEKCKEAFYNYEE